MNPAQQTVSGTTLPTDDPRERLATAYYEPVRKFFLRKGISSDRALELTQDTFLRVSRAEEVPADPEAARGWLFCIALNVFKNELRAIHADKRDGTEVSVPGDNSELARLEAEISVAGGAAEEDSFFSLLWSERQGILDDLLNELPPKMREVLLMRVGQDLKYREIATLLQIELDTVKSHLSQAKARLEKHLRGRLHPLDFGGSKERP